jgi:hypothetical protein
MTGRESIGRTILVIEDQPYLWATLRQRIPTATAYTRSAAPDEVRAVWRSCRPWPWVVVATTRAAPDGLVELLDGLPVPVHWLGQPPPELLGRAASHDDWLHLVAELERLNDLTANGPGRVQLLRNRGVIAPDGRLVLDAPLVEGLLAAPAGLPLPVDAEALRAELEANHLPPVAPGVTAP